MTYSLPLTVLLVLASPCFAQDNAPIRVFLLAGQSNMEGKAKVSLLERQLENPRTRAEFAHLQPNGKWIERDDVWIKFLDRQGKLSVGYGSPNRIGPELEFGLEVGDRYEEPVLLIKTAWGGKSLFRDFRPPSSGLPEEKVLLELLQRTQKKRPQTTLEEIRDSFGAYYRRMIDEISNTLKNLDDVVPNAEGRRYQLAGFVWFQGWNDMINPAYTAEYTANMANFVRDVRRQLQAPDLPFVIGQLGVGGLHEERPNQKKKAFKSAQAAVGRMPEFQGNLVVVPTDVLWDNQADAVFKKGWKENLQEWEQVGSDRPYHYLGSVRCYGRMGKAFAEAVLGLAQHP